MESVGTSRGRVFGTAIRDISYDSTHTNVIGGTMMQYRLFRTPKPQSVMDLPTVTEVAEEV